MIFYDFFGSASAYRVRIVLNLKGLHPDRVNVKITEGEQFAPQYLKLNPTAAVPSLVDGDKRFIQSFAIAEYLDETHPNPSLMPNTPAERARVRAIAQTIACDIQPLHPGRIAKYLSDSLGVGEEGVQRWCKHWVTTGMKAVEALLASDARTARYCHGDTPTLADVALVPQIYVGANRFKLDMASICPEAWRIFQNCMELPQFRDAALDRHATVD